MKCPKCNVKMYNNCCMRCGYMPNGSSVNDEEKIDGIGKITDKENQKQEQITAYNEYLKAKKEYKKHKRKKRFIILIILIALISFIKIKFGIIEIGNPFYYPDNKVLLYDVKINNTSISTDNTTIHKLPIIPFLVNFNSVSLYQTDIVEGLEREYYVDESNQFILSVKAYSCHSKNVKGQVTCDYSDYNQILKEKSNVKYTHLYIKKNSRYEKVLYDGKFINDITEYISEKGRYTVCITAKYGLVEVSIYFDIVNKA